MRLNVFWVLKITVQKFILVIKVLINRESLLLTYI